MKVFITGGTSGMGRALAALYLAEGCEVGVCGGDEAAFERGWPDPPPGLRFFDLDVRDRDACRRVIAEFGGGELDLAVACAGINNGVPREKIDLSDFDRSIEILDVNLKGVMHTFEAALHEMLPRGRGWLAAVSSAACFLGWPGTGAYSASKLGVVRYCETLGLELDARGIGVTCIIPGYVDTPMFRAMNPHVERKPFMMSADAAAARIKLAIERRRVCETFPLPVKAMGWWMTVSPRGLFRWRMRRARRRARARAEVGVRSTAP